MKWFLFLAVVFTTGGLFAAQPVQLYPGLPESNYAVTQSSQSISSSTITTDGVVSGYRLICLGNLSANATVYYRIDGTTTSVASFGYPVYPASSGCFEYSGLVGYQLGAGSSAIEVRKKVIRK